MDLWGCLQKDIWATAIKKKGNIKFPFFHFKILIIILSIKGKLYVLF
jgi:hypothetical protein